MTDRQKKGQTKEMGENCKEEKGIIVRTWMTGDEECDAESTEFECGGIYHHNYMDVVGNRDHDCFWDCTGCKKGHTLTK